MSDHHEEEPKLPRILEAGEFYCWLCREFVPMANAETHAKEHRTNERKTVNG